MHKTITLTHEQYAMLLAGKSITIEPPKPKQWEPKNGDWCFARNGEIVNFPSIKTHINIAEQLEAKLNRKEVVS